MILSNSQQFLNQFKIDSHWFLPILDDSQVSLKLILIDSYQFLNKSEINSHVSWWFLVILESVWYWFTLILSDSQISLKLILIDSWWFLVILDDSHWFSNKSEIDFCHSQISLKLILIASHCFSVIFKSLWN